MINYLIYNKKLPKSSYPIILIKMYNRKNDKIY